MAGDSQTAKFPPTHPHFIALQSFPADKLKIPKKFVRKYGGTLRDDVSLKLPCGSEWRLGLTKSRRGSVWICNGWAEFSDHYSIGIGNFLHMKYDGDSQFQVVIYNSTATEIDYPLKSRSEIETPNHDESVTVNQEREVIEISGDDADNPTGDLDTRSECSRYGKRPGKRSPFSRSDEGMWEGSEGDDDSTFVPPLPRSRSQKRGRESRYNSGIRDVSPEATNSRASEDLLGSLPRKRTAMDNGGEESSDTSLQRSWEETERATMIASAFKSEHPFFLVLLRDSHVRSQDSRMYVPAWFAKSHLGFSKQVVLKAHDRPTSYLVNYKFRGSSSYGPCFLGGWLPFSQENGLKKGDLCVFAMNSSTEPISFEVSFFRKNAPKGKTSAVDLTFRNPTFEVYMHASRYSRLIIPINFARTYMKTGPCEVSVRDSDGKYCQFTYDYRVDHRNNQKQYEFGRGWSKFRMAKGLEKGDTLF